MKIVFFHFPKKVRKTISEIPKNANICSERQCDMDKNFKKIFLENK